MTYKDIPGFPGYRAGDDGTVWSCRQPGPNRPLARLWVLLKPRISHNGYERYTLFKKGHRHGKFGHILVLEAFVGPCPDGMECRHPDRSRTNNRLENLSWGTRQENEGDKISHGTKTESENHWKAALNTSDIITIRKRYSDGVSRSQLAKEYGTTWHNIHRIVKRKSWRSVP